MKMLVIADDFTGANDTGVQLAKKGACTEVMLNIHQKPSRRAQVLVINTESRGLEPAAAAQVVSHVLDKFKHDDLLIYKKIDSTFRGNIGAEIEAAMRGSGKTLALIAAAIPAAGRTTQAGKCLVHNVLLDQTEYASDPKTPVISSCIKTLIAQQSDLPVYEIALDKIRAGNLAEQLSQFYQQQPCILVLDAVNEQDLSLIAQAAMTLKPVPLLAGAAGLASALPAKSWQKPHRVLPILIVAGSMSEVTRQQINFALNNHTVQIVDIDVVRFFDTETNFYQQHVAQQAIDLLNHGSHCLLRTSRSADDRKQIMQLCQCWQLSRAQLGKSLSHKVGELTLKIIENTRIGGLFLTGGDMAIAVADALGASGYRIHTEVAPCIPCGTFINSEIDDLPVITKAGGFGSTTILCDAVAFIEEMYRE